MKKKTGEEIKKELNDLKKFMNPSDTSEASLLHKNSLNNSSQLPFEDVINVPSSDDFFKSVSSKKIFGDKEFSTN